jgi:hypothetical protein
MRPASPSAHTHSAFALRFAALALVLLSVGGQVAGVADLLLVRHAVCAEHGELIHVAAAQDAGSPRDGVKVGAASAGYHEAEPREVNDGHDHCGVSALRRERITLAKARAELLGASITCIEAALVARMAAPASFDLLLLAPKSSPPARLG